MRTKDSGKHKGRRKLTKKGDPEYRRLLYNAAMAATKTGYYFNIWNAWWTPLNALDAKGSWAKVKSQPAS